MWELLFYNNYVIIRKLLERYALQSTKDIGSNDLDFRPNSILEIDL